MVWIETGGAEGIRTPDLINAIDALSQLSYSPTAMGSASRIRRWRSEDVALPCRYLF